MKRLLALLLLAATIFSATIAEAARPRHDPPIVGAGPRARLFGVRTGATRSPWRPTLVASADKTTIQLGESFTVTYSTEYATSVQRDATHWAPFVGQSDGVIIPLSSSYTLTPTAPGEFTTVIRAFRRNRDLNLDGRADGARRSATVTVIVTVLQLTKGTP